MGLTRIEKTGVYIVFTDVDSGLETPFASKDLTYTMDKETLKFYKFGDIQIKPRDGFLVGLTGTVELDTGASGSVDGISVDGVEIMSGANATAVMSSVAPNTFADGTVTLASVTLFEFATGTAQCTTVLADDTITVNGLLYTAVSGTPAEDEFDIDTGDDETATSLATQITADTRSGTLNDVTATATTDTVTMTQTVTGVGGNATTLAQVGDTITLSGATFSGGSDPDNVTINGNLYTAVAGTKTDFTEFTMSGTDTVNATDLAHSIHNDTRSGTSGDLSASSSSAIVTATTDVSGTGGNAITLVSSDGTRIGVSGSGTLTGGVTAETITVNGLAYTAISGSKGTDNTKFSTDVDDDATATSLADSITNDTRAGTLNDVTATATTDTVTMTQTVSGAGGKATTLAETGSGITISGATFDGAVAFDTSLTITATNVSANITAHTSVPNYSASSVVGLITIKIETDHTAVDGLTVASEVTTIATTDVNMGVDTGNLEKSAGTLFISLAELVTFLRANTGA